ncbi:HTH-type transcriptional activator RhaS [compost metagenome]
MKSPIMFRLQQTDLFDQNRIISVLPRAPQEPFPEHCHSFHELVLIKSGCAIHITDGSAVHISRGSVFYLREDDAHMFDQMKDLCLTNVLFRPEGFHLAGDLEQMLQTSCHPGSGVLRLPAHLQAHSETLLGQIAQESDRRDACSSVMIEALFSQLAVLLWRTQQRALTGEQGEADQARLSSLISYLDENYREEIDWSELSERFTIPLRTLNRKIQEHTGLTPNNYLGRLRLCRASWLLSHTEKSVTEIAFESGFNDGNYFSSKFHHVFEATPLQYRKRYK